MQLEPFSIYLDQFRTTFQQHQKAVRFILKHRLWNGFWEYGWVSRLLLVIAVILGFKFLSLFFQWLQNARINDPIGSLSSMTGMFQNFFVEGFHFLFFGSMKYVMLILLEVVIFHVSRRTLEILSGNESHVELKDFIRAQIRMIKVAFFSWVLEMIATSAIGTALGMIPLLKFTKPGWIFVIQCYLLGFAVIDNYFEQFGLTIKESFKMTGRYIGVALASGLVLQILFPIPVLGTILGPLLAAVTVTMVMFTLSDLHLHRETDPETVGNPVDWV